MDKLILVLGLLLLPCVSWGESVQLMPDLAVEVSLPGDRWELSRQPPEFLVLEMAAHADEDMLAKARKAGITEPEEMVRKMLSANELYIFNRESGAYLLVDFSRLRPEEKAPSRRAIARSAKFAGESLESEEGYGDVSYETGKVRVRGAEVAHRLDARFSKHGQKTQFVGIVGFAEPYWFYLYYTDPLKDDKDRAEMNEILETLRLQKRGE